MAKQFFPLEGIEAATDGLFPFGSNGFTHELVKQDGPVCLVRRHKKDRQLHYEVVILQWRKDRILPDGSFRAAAWAYPGSEQWGTYGWTYNDAAKARVRYDETRARMARERFTEGQKGLPEAPTEPLEG